MNNKIKIAFVMTSCKKSGPVQQYLNIIKNLNRDEFEAHLVTIYSENKETSQFELYKPFVIHHFAHTSKVDILTGRTQTLQNVLKEINPDVIHSMGLFPDLAVCRMKRYKQITTLRNFVYEDYPVKFGKLRGLIMSKLHIYAMTHTTKTVTCSQSLANIYKQKLNLTYNYIRNGVDIEQYSCPSDEEKMVIRKEMNLPKDSFIFVYTGQLIKRKNMDFLLSTFADTFKDKKYYLLVLGGGAQFDELKERYGNTCNIDFRGSVLNVNHYLKACDAYVSTSKSEGLPNGVLEAMATGIPVILSDIPQHIEVMSANNESGLIFDINDKSALATCLTQMVEGDYKKMGEAAYLSAHENFSAIKMSNNYQNIYRELSSK
jgi:glycosyltransferase involved in cell wall biosynthesis